MRRRTLASIALNALLAIALVVATASMIAAEAGVPAQRGALASGGVTPALPSFGPQELPPLEPLGR